jgi:hypothetical protein
MHEPRHGKLQRAFEPRPCRIRRLAVRSLRESLCSIYTHTFLELVARTRAVAEVARNMVTEAVGGSVLLCGVRVVGNVV